jgi:hypothetical protein
MDRVWLLAPVRGNIVWTPIFQVGVSGTLRVVRRILQSLYSSGFQCLVCVREFLYTLVISIFYFG